MEVLQSTFTTTLKKIHFNGSIDITEKCSAFLHHFYIKEVVGTNLKCLALLFMELLQDTITTTLKRAGKSSPLSASIISKCSTRWWMIQNRLGLEIFFRREFCENDSIPWTLDTYVPENSVNMTFQLYCLFIYWLMSAQNWNASLTPPFQIVMVLSILNHFINFMAINGLSRVTK